MRFVLLELIVTAAVLFLIFKTVVWIVRASKPKIKEIDEALKKEESNG